MELNNEEITATLHISCGLEKAQPSFTLRNDHGKELSALLNKRERQQRYREQNID